VKFFFFIVDMMSVATIFVLAAAVFEVPY